MANTIQEFIRSELDDNSGGMKFLDLLVRVSHSPFKGFAGSLEDIINKMDDVKILTYTWHRLNRDIIEQREEIKEMIGVM